MGQPHFLFQPRRAHWWCGRAPGPATAALLLILLPCLWHWPLLTGLLPDFMDTVTALYPLRIAAARQFGAGFWPLWLPNQAGGYPLAANPQVALWYPPQWPFYLLPHPIVNGLILVGHVVAAGLGLYRWARVSGARRGPALLGAVGFQFGAALVSRIALTPHLYALAWIPWILWATEKTVLVRNGIHWGWCVAVSLFVSLQVLSGAPQITYYTGLLLPLWWVGRGWQAGGRSGAIRVLGQGIVAMVLVLLITSIQLLPTVELLNQSARASLGTDRLRSQGLNGHFLWTSLIGGTGPLIEDTDSINAIGLGLLLLVPLALLHRRWRSISVLTLGLGLLFYVLALGMMAPVLAGRLPLYASFHAPRRALLVWSVLGPFLAVAGAMALTAWLRMGRRHRLTPYILLLLLVPNVWMLPRLERDFADPERFQPDPRIAKAIGESRFLTMDPVFRYAYDSRRADFGRSLLPDLAAWQNLMDVQVYDPLVLKRMARFRRAVNSASGEFYPSHGVLFSDPGHPALGMLALQYIIGRWDLYDPSRLIPGTRTDRDRLASLLETQPTVDSYRWPLWRFREKRPMAWLPEAVQPALDAEQALTLGLAQNHRKIMFDETRRHLGTWPPIPADSVEVTRPGPDRFHIRFAPEAMTTGSETRPVALASVWMPGWRARVLHSNPDSQFQPDSPVPTYPLNGLIIGVDLPRGVRAMEVIYRPASFRVGIILTILGIMAAGALARLGRRAADEPHMSRPDNTSITTNPSGSTQG